MNQHLKYLLEEFRKNKSPEMQTDISAILQQYIETEKAKEISTIRYREIVTRIKPLFQDQEELLSRINGYKMVSYDRSSVVHILKTKFENDLTLRETADRFHVSKNTIMKWEKKLKADPEMRLEVEKKLHE